MYNTTFFIKVSVELMIGDRFIRFKMQVVGLQEAVSKHFAKILNSIEAGLPEVKDEENFCRELVSAEYEKAMQSWTCPICTTSN